jgi:hypothetical protein
VDIPADPGTYGYHGEPEWRSYFHSTIGHNTVEIDGRDQSAQSGAFMWARQAQTDELPVSDQETDWAAEHDGYAMLSPPARHRRTVKLDRTARSIEIIDGGTHNVRMPFHLGPDVVAELSTGVARLARQLPDGSGRRGWNCPANSAGGCTGGETDPILGRYSPGLGERIPAVILLGSGCCAAGSVLTTRLTFLESLPCGGDLQQFGDDRERLKQGANRRVDVLPDR